MLLFHYQHNIVIVFVNNSRKLLERQYLFILSEHFDSFGRFAEVMYTAYSGACIATKHWLVSKEQRFQGLGEARASLSKEDMKISPRKDFRCPTFVQFNLSPSLETCNTFPQESTWMD